MQILYTCPKAGLEAGTQQEPRALQVMVRFASARGQVGEGFKFVLFRGAAVRL